MRREGLLSELSGQPAPLWRVGGAWAESPGPGTFDAQKINAIWLLIPDRILLAAAIVQ